MCFLSCLVPILLMAQTPVELNGGEANLWDHRKGPQEAIHLDASKLGLSPFEMFGANVELEVVVSPNGVVNDARAVSGPKELYQRAEQIELGRLFKPFTHDGTIVTAKIHDYVSIAPPEAWLTAAVPLLAEVNMSTVIMSLARTGCFGKCPAYKVSIAGNGSVTFDGGTDVLVPGHHTAHISTAAARDLFYAFRKADFLSARDRYEASVTDAPTYSISLTLGGRTKTVVNYMGTEVGMPDAVRGLERQVDDTADTERWIKGSPETLPTLKAEKWDFSSGSPDNMALYRSAISRGDEQMLDRFVTAKAPIDLAGTNLREMAPVCSASATGNLALVQRMMNKRTPIRKDILQPCLAAAARGGNLEILELWLARGANPIAWPPKEAPNWELNILAEAISSGKPAVVQRLLDYPFDLRQPVRGDTPLLTLALYGHGDKDEVNEVLTLLVHAGVSPNERGHLRETPLFDTTFHPWAIKTLVALGVNVDARNENGTTALIYQAYAPEAVHELLDAGADPALVDKSGHTALMQAGQCKPCADAIKAAIARRAKASSN
jgi:ankyrin repeat protein